jgi:hypothetical protein
MIPTRGTGRFILSWIVLFSLWSNSAGDAGTSSWGGILSSSGEGARAMAMAGAFCAIADDATATFWNPAALNYLRHNQLTFHYNQPYSLSFLDHYYVGITKSGDRFGSGGLDFRMNDIELGDDTYTEFAVGYGYARGIGTFVSVGASIHYIRIDTDIDDISGNGFHGNIGIIGGYPIDRTHRVKVGLHLRNVLSHVSFSTGTDERLPVRGSLGVAVFLWNRLILAVDLYGSEEDFTKKVAAGLELACCERMLFLRSGAMRRLIEPNDLLPCAGLGVRYQNLLLDYGFEIDKETLGDTHRFSITVAY